jgi:hypothetical protein
MGSTMRASVRQSDKSSGNFPLTMNTTGLWILAPAKAEFYCGSIPISLTASILDLSVAGKVELVE